MNYLCNFKILRNLTQHPLFTALFAWRQEKDSQEKYTAFLFEIYRENAQDNVLKFMSQLVKYDDNAFSRACCGAEVSPYLEKAFADDLMNLGALLREIPKSGDYHLGKADALLQGFDECACERLASFYKENGFGAFAQYKAFRFSQGELLPILSPSKITLKDLKGYEREKAEVMDNFENFVQGLPFADMLLYGDRGTGKSSTVHAMINLFENQKLRLIEVAKEELLALPSLKARLAKIPMKFVVFIDDFSLAENDERFSTLKACLQGSMEGLSENVMILATSNRRHVVEENFDTRRNSVHAGDSEQELLSLSDRFGITVLFSQTGKEEYLAIVDGLARDYKLKTPLAVLEPLAERWALYGSGRSPRRAKQFIDYAVACEAKQKEITV